jgi:hypothetical protein
VRHGLDRLKIVASKFFPAQEVARFFAPHYRTGEYTQYSFLEDKCVVCFCGVADLLSQWRAYGKDGAGYCIGFKSVELARNAELSRFELMPIVHKPELQERMLGDLFERAIETLSEIGMPLDSNAASRILNEGSKLSLLFKNQGFEEEREWRLLCTDATHQLQYRPGRWGIVPYKPIPFTHECIAEVWQGPTLDHAASTRTLELFLREHYGEIEGQPTVPVHRSAIPLRSI